MREALASDWQGLKKEAHSLAGLCVHIRANPLVDALRALQDQARRLEAGLIVKGNSETLLTLVSIELVKTKAAVAMFVEDRTVPPVAIV